ncbi:hypothetical protein V6N13_029813 [Hibiscus sabdariffa]
MVDTGLVEVVSKSLGVRGFDLAEFPPLGEGQAGATVAGVMLLIRGLRYVASAIGKPMYTDMATTLKQQLEFAKICIEVGAVETILNTVLVELDEGLTVEIAVELVWSPPRYGQCSIFGHSEDKCSKKKVVDDSVAKVDGDHERNCDAKVDDNRTNNGDVKVDEGFSCDDDGSMGVDNHDGQVVSPQKIRAAARGIADLMNKLKEKVKEVKEPKGPKKKNQGNGGQRVKVNKGGEFSPLL